MVLTYYKKGERNVRLFFEVPARIELASKEPESFILSIKLWDHINKSDY